MKIYHDVEETKGVWCKHDYFKPHQCEHDLVQAFFLIFTKSAFGFDTVLSNLKLIDKLMANDICRL